MAHFFPALQEIFRRWNKNKSGDLAASLAFYLVLSLPSLVILFFYVGKLFLGGNENILTNIQKYVEPSTFQALGQIVDSITHSSKNSAITIVGFLILIISSSLFFEHLVRSLCIIFEGKRKEKTFFQKVVLNRIWSVIFVAFILIIIFISIAAKFLLQYIKNFFHLPTNYLFETLWWLLNYSLTFIFPWLMFLFIYRFLSYVPITWTESSKGAFISTFLLIIGSYLLELYFQYFMDFSSFGAASAIVVVLVWTYYICQLIFLGAEITAFSFKTYRREKT